MIEEFARILLKQIKLADDDSAVALLFAAVAYFADFFFFPEGMPSATAAFLAAIVGFSLSKLLKNRWFFLKFGLRRIKVMEDDGLLPSPEARQLRQRLIRRWFENVYGLTVDSGQETQAIESSQKESSYEEDQSP
ncbi:MAG: hypothetical protein ACREEM_02120 [Blastocatellia bacterium]